MAQMLAGCQGHGLQSIIAALDEAKGSEAQDDDVTLVMIKAPG